jgi:hypothetical protein
LIAAMICFRLLDSDDPAEPLAQAVAKVREGENSSDVYSVNPTFFRQVPNAPFAYWASGRILGLFGELPPFEEGGRSVRVGLQTSDDFRFVRVFWEVPEPETATISSERWKLLLKGDSVSSFYDDITMAVNWSDDGSELKQFTTQIEKGGNWSRNIRATDYYFRPGMSWALRTSRFMPSCVAKDCIPTVSRYLAVSEKTDVLTVVSICNSSIFDALCKLSVERHGHPKFIAGLLKSTPFPKLERQQENHLSTLGRCSWSLKRNTDTANLTSHAFYAPALTPSRTKHSPNHTS